MPLRRLDANPLLSPADVAPTRSDLEVLCTSNPAAVRFGREIILLVRVGEKPPDTDDTIATLVYEPGEGNVKAIRIRRDDPDLADVTPVTMVYRGRALLTSMSHLRVARSADGVPGRSNPIWARKQDARLVSRPSGSF